MLAAAGTGEASAASSATLAGRVSRLPAPKTRVFATARAVVGRTGQVVAVQDLGGASRFRLRVGTGRYLVVAASQRADGRFARAVSRLLTARRGHTTSKNVKARASVAGGPVVTIGDIRLTPQPGLGGPTLLLRDRIITQLFGPLSARGVRIVDLSPAVVAALKREQQLSDDGRTAQKFSYSPLKPQFEITGTGVAGPGGALALQLDLKNIATGQVVSSKTVTGAGNDLPGLIADAAGGLIADAGPVLDQPPAAECPPDCAGTGKVVVDLLITFLIPGSRPAGGTVTVTPPGRSFTPADVQNTSFEYVVSDGTTVTLVGKPDAGSYFVGWQSGSECGPNDYEPPGDTYNCTVTDQGGYGRFAINVGADFAQCPPPGTFVFNAPNEAVCPGVTIVPPS